MREYNWAIEVYAPSEKDARRIGAMLKRRGVYVETYNLRGYEMISVTGESFTTLSSTLNVLSKKLPHSEAEVKGVVNMQGAAGPGWGSLSFPRPKRASGSRTRADAARKVMRKAASTLAKKGGSAKARSEAARKLARGKKNPRLRSLTKI